ncbi:MAG: response regulator [Acidobacteriia bacterium]|nr:response regulator [Terriglobia bacterium]
MNTILIVEDDRNLLRLYQAEMETEGYRVLLAKNGNEATECVARETPDLIIMDIRMPDKDGLDAMAEILRNHGKIPIILNSAYSSYQDDFLTWAADAYVIKSADLEPLKIKIREILSLREDPLSRR